MSLDIADLHLSFGDTEAVSGVNLAVDTGERFAIMGPSGAGKTTLLRAIAGLDRPHSGDIAIDGSSVVDVPSHARRVGLMFQDFALFPHMTVAENIAFGPKMAGASRSIRFHRANDLLDLVGLGGFGGRDPATLSGGEQQRVALARTLAADPKVVLFDEPLGSVDQGLKEDLIGSMKRIMSHVGATSVYVTHDRHEAEAYADRMAIMRSGSVRRVGTSAEIWNDPQTPFVARFIGHRNVLDASALGLEGTTILVHEDAIAIGPGGSAAEVVDSVFRDGGFLTTIKVGDGVLTVGTPDRFAPGDRVAYSVNPERVLPLFTE